MFEAKFKTSFVFKRIIEVFKDLIKDGNFQCNDTGIWLQSMDSSHVALVSLFLDANNFEHYRCDSNISLDMRIESLHKIVKCANDKDSMFMMAKPNDDTVVFTFENEDRRASVYKMKLMCIDMERLEAPDSNFDCVLHMSSSEFARLCKDSLQFSDSITLNCDKAGLKLQVNGDITSAEIQLVSGVKDFTLVKMDRATKLTFAGKYLNIFAKAASLSPQVIIHMSKELPLLIEYYIKNIGFIKFYLAPKISDTDDDDGNDHDCNSENDDDNFN
ncbi:Proliferating celular nuclear antigen [Lonomia obliqua multiple nucleopolyhedrovirus]|uniref:Proliferating celular nuclear antigen n=1 Tax=Lonomia obliqua multiple nucleopolyhedrovirus TaxID=134394 RepID=A0A126FC73_9ABAC|nr:Proliferating celular nuclear antigen [Lonomia obliqua multiple nucleopolyhedrovirus]AKN80994.1 Proliferating celular nuclear antigen [Lonomia obliqua multiple nucleopolyhedrovirus]